MHYNAHLSNKEIRTLSLFPMLVINVCACVALHMGIVPKMLVDYQEHIELIFLRIES